MRRAALAVAGEGILLALTGLAYGAVALTRQPENRLAAALEAGMGVLAGLGLLLLARALAQLRRWARSPVVVAQILALPVGFGLGQAHLWLPAVVVVGAALAVLGLLAVPACRSAFRGG